MSIEHFVDPRLFVGPRHSVRVQFLCGNTALFVRLYGTPDKIIINLQIFFDLKQTLQANNVD